MEVSSAGLAPNERAASNLYVQNSHCYLNLDTDSSRSMMLADSSDQHL